MMEDRIAAAVGLPARGSDAVLGIPPSRRQAPF